MLRVLKFFPCGLLKARWRPQGKNTTRFIENGEACARGVTGQMPWRDLLRRSHLPPPVIAECEAQLGGLDPRRPAGAEGQDHPERGTPGAGECRCGRPGGQSGLKPADPDPAVGAICAEPERSQSMAPGAGLPEAAEDPALAGAEALRRADCGGRTIDYRALVYETAACTLPKLTNSFKTLCFRPVSGQVGLPKFTNTYHLNRKQNGNIVLADFGRIFSHRFTHGLRGRFQKFQVTSERSLF